MLHHLFCVFIIIQIPKSSAEWWPQIQLRLNWFRMMWKHNIVIFIKAYGGPLKKIIIKKTGTKHNLFTLSVFHNSPKPLKTIGAALIRLFNCLLSSPDGHYSSCLHPVSPHLLIIVVIHSCIPLKPKAIILCKPHPAACLSLVNGSFRTRSQAAELLSDISQKIPVVFFLFHTLQTSLRRGGGGGGGAV